MDVKKMKCYYRPLSTVPLQNPGCLPRRTETRRTSMVGSYSSTKWFWMSWMVSALLPTPPAPTTTSLYSVMSVAAAHRTIAQFL